MSFTALQKVPELFVSHDVLGTGVLMLLILRIREWVTEVQLGISILGDGVHHCVNLGNAPFAGFNDLPGGVYGMWIRSDFDSYDCHNVEVLSIAILIQR